jgi:hypothetical protein
MTTIVNIHKTKIYDIYCGRGSKWGNPYTHIKDRNTKAKYIVDSRALSIIKYKEWILTQPELLDSLEELNDKILGCYCLPKSCHCQVLVDLINESKIYSIF